jgi:hypothetical protein
MGQNAFRLNSEKYGIYLCGGNYSENTSVVGEDNYR